MEGQISPEKIMLLTALLQLTAVAVPYLNDLFHYVWNVKAKWRALQRWLRRE
jgi:hypothetical protein